MSQTITIDPVTRLEGHGKVTIQLNEQGEVTDAHFHVTQVRGFERFAEGRPFYEMPSLMARICGICPVSHLVASAKACEAIMSVRIPHTAAQLRRMLNLAQMVQSHALSFFYLSAPDLVMGMESDPKIGMAVPVCDASCNYQQITLPYQTMDEMQSLAASYNVSNPNLWEERLKLITYTGIYRTDLQKVLGGFDEDFNPGCYDDDAICFSIRRMGYKVIFAKDTFVHHFGSRSFNEEYAKDNTLQYRNRNLFIRKFGVNPYEVGVIDFNVLNLLNYDGASGMNILGIGKSFGTTLLQLKNVCKSYGSKDIGLYYLSEQEGSMIELKTICDDCAHGSVDDVQERFGSRSYDYIVVESESRTLQNKEALFTTLYGLLNTGGQLVCTAANATILYEIMVTLARLGANFDRQLNNYYYLCFSKPK